MIRTAKNNLLVGGIGRSGTSILAKLLASTKNSEFFYEPPVFMHLLESLSVWKNDKELKDLLETILYKDLMKGALSGRSLNLNRNDISSVYNYKSEEDIASRFNSSFRQEQLQSQMSESQAIIKVLDNIYQFKRLQRILPVFKAIVILRNPIDTARSLKVKGWFSNEQLSLRTPEPLRNMKKLEGKRYPNFVQPKDYQEWNQYSELERIGYYYKFHLNKFNDLREDKDVLFITYENLIRNPEKCFYQLTDILQLQLGTKTKEVLDSIQLKTPGNDSFKNEFKASLFGESCIDRYRSLVEKLNK